MDIEKAHRVGQRMDHRPVIARFTKFSEREAIMKNVTKLQVTRIYVNEDLCPASQVLRKQNVPFSNKRKVKERSLTSATLD